MMRDDQTFAAILADGKRRLSNAAVATPGLDARILLEHVSGFSHSELISKAGDDVVPDLNALFNDAIARRIAGEPVHRIVGARDFYGRQFSLSPETLVPRPDTETLIDEALKRFGGSNASLDILDIGTGSGVIGLTLLAELEKAELVAVDVSDQALEIAQSNARRLGLEKGARFLASDMFSNVEGVFDLIVSNPPYIPTGDLESLDRIVREHDPELALDGGADGLDFYRILFSQSPEHMKPDAVLMVEFGIDQTQYLITLAHSLNMRVEAIARDLAGIDRVMVLTQSM